MASSSRDDIREEGRLEGYEQGLNEVLDWIQSRYIGENDRPDRDSDEGKILLQFAREAATFVRGKVKTS